MKTQIYAVPAVKGLSVGVFVLSGLTHGAAGHSISAQPDPYNDDIFLHNLWRTKVFFNLKLSLKSLISKVYAKIIQRCKL